jgi:hypothetical protein
LRHELRTTRIIIDIVVAEVGTAPAPPAFSAFRFERYAIKSGITSPGASRDRTEAVQACRADAAHPSRMSAASLIRRKPVGRSPASAPSASSAPVSRTLGTGMARIVARQALMSPTPLTILDRAFSRAALILIILFPARPSRLKVISMPSARKKVCARRSRPASRGGFLRRFKDAIGTKRTCRDAAHMSAFGGRADSAAEPTNQRHRRKMVPLPLWARCTRRDF